ncbi:hypothetical protein V5O48_008407, partial [Marasmius crinis-equi]
SPPPRANPQPRSDILIINEANHGSLLNNADDCLLDGLTINYGTPEVTQEAVIARKPTDRGVPPACVPSPRVSDSPQPGRSPSRTVHNHRNQGSVLNSGNKASFRGLSINYRNGYSETAVLANGSLSE